MAEEAEEADDTLKEPFVYQQDTTEIPTDIVRLVTDASLQAFPKRRTFRYFHSLVEVFLSEGLVEIADSAFFDCRALQKVSIPSTVKKTGKRSFHLCTSLVDVSLTEGLVAIEHSAFGCCTALTTIKLPSSVAIIENFAFGSCISLKHAQLQEGLQFIGSQAFQSCGTLADIDIPSTVHTIEWGAFRGCRQLSRVGMQEGLLEQLDEFTFARCYNLSSIAVPSNIKSIQACFSNCKSLVFVELVSGLETILDGAFMNCKALRVVDLPSTIHEIGKRAFSGCEGLSEINLPEGLVQIRTTAFFGCSSLSALCFPTSLELVEKLAFGSCSSLLGVEFPNGSNVQLQGAVFHKCVRLINLSFPSSMELVTGVDVLFLGCERLQDMIDNKILVPSLRERFHGLGVHQACYASANAALDGLSKALSLCDDQVTKDCFGMTPFHIVATSFYPRTDILGTLLDKFGNEALYHADVHGTTMMDCMLQHHSPRIVPLIQMVLERTTIAAMSGWGMEEWKFIISGYLALLSQEDNETTSRRNQTLRKLGEHITLFFKLEMTSLLEQSLWKMKRKGLLAVNEEDCRLLCGAPIVIPQVVAYLWDDATSLGILSWLFPFNISDS